MSKQRSRVGLAAHRIPQALILLLVHSAATVAETPPTLPTWLVGCWESEDGRSLEAWSQDDDTTLIGFSSIVSEGKVSFYELMSIRLHEDGQLVFTAYPSNQPGGSFPTVRQEAQGIVFQNGEHDYPQRIRYRRAGEQLIADIALSNGDQQVDFRKSACGGK
ncbi:MAG: DUF6265 family protein [Pseudomonadota bacterium]